MTKSSVYELEHNRNLLKVQKAVKDSLGPSSRRKKSRREEKKDKNYREEGHRPPRLKPGASGAA